MYRMVQSISPRALSQDSFQYSLLARPLWTERGVSLNIPLSERLLIGWNRPIHTVSWMSGSRSTQGNNTRSWYPKWCTVKAEIFSGVLFSVTSVPTIFTEKMHRTFSVLLSGTSTLTWKAGNREVPEYDFSCQNPWRLYGFLYVVFEQWKVPGYGTKITYVFAVIA